MIGTTEARRRARALLPMVGLVAGFGGLLGLGACDDDDVNLIVPPVNRVVAVFKDSTFNFASLHTFAMPDTVVHFNPVTGTPIAVSRQFDAVALNQVRQNLLARGYTEVLDPRTTTPSFIVLVGATATTNFNAFVGFPFFSTWGFSTVWGWFTPGFTTAWDLVFPWFTVVGATAFERGTLIVEIVPTASVNAGNRTIRAAWAGVATGLLDGTITNATITAAIDQMFALSPYLTNTSPLAAR